MKFKITMTILNPFIKAVLMVIRFLIGVTNRSTYFLKRAQAKIRTTPWRIIKGDETLRVNYPLSHESTVFDVGGYKGTWSEDIYEKYKSTIYIFEPINKFTKEITERFSNNNDIHIYAFGLGKEDTKTTINLEGDASSIYTENKDNTEQIEIKSISNFIKENNIKNIDLIKINIEGGEYDLLDDLIQSKLVNIVKNIQVQFHELDSHSYKKMKDLQKLLGNTHVKTYGYDFVWENWKLENTQDDNN